MRHSTLVSACGFLMVALFVFPRTARSEGATAPTIGFDKLSCADLAVGVPGDLVGGDDRAGAVNIFYGVAPGGFDSLTDHLVSQDSGGPNPAEVNDRLGHALAVGDFDGDGYVDLAAGAPGETVGGDASAGAVSIFPGSASGVTGTGVQFWYQDLGTIGCCVSEPSDHFGQALAVGDFDRDGFDDLAIGAWGEEWGEGTDDCGIVHVLYGSGDGLTADRDQYWYQGGAGLQGEREVNDWFGSALAAGDYDGDGYDDLAIGAEGEDGQTGCVHVLYGTGSGLDASRDDLWFQSALLGGGSPDAGEAFGHALITGDFDGDGIDDLGVGVPYQTVGADQSGAVNVIYGTSTGLDAAGNDYWNQALESIINTAEEDDFFGWSLGAGDFDSSGHDDLVVGVPYENHSTGSITNGGMVHVLYGTDDGLTHIDDQGWHQGLSTVTDTPHDLDYYGQSVAAADFNCDGYDDLAIGIPGEVFNFGSHTAEGAINVLYGSSGGLTGDDDLFWGQYHPWVAGDADDIDEFGYALAATRLQGIFSDGFESGNTMWWSSSTE